MLKPLKRAAALLMLLALPGAFPHTASAETGAMGDIRRAFECEASPAGNVETLREALKTYRTDPSSLALEVVSYRVPEGLQIFGFPASFLAIEQRTGDPFVEAHARLDAPFESVVSAVLARRGMSACAYADADRCELTERMAIGRVTGDAGKTDLWCALN